MTDIPEDILNTARTVADKSCHDYTVNVLTIARAILAERNRDRWMPIDTAPKDGTEIILFCPKGDGTPGKMYRVTAGQWYVPPTITYQMTPDVEGDEPPSWLSWDGGFSEDTMMPTHWMPLPEPPEDGGHINPSHPQSPP